MEFIHSFRKKWKGSFCHRFHRLSPGGRLGGGEKTLGHISEHRFRFLACSGALRLLQVIALCILDISILWHYRWYKTISLYSRVLHQLWMDDFDSWVRIAILTGIELKEETEIYILRSNFSYLRFGSATISWQLWEGNEKWAIFQRGRAPLPRRWWRWWGWAA